MDYSKDIGCIFNVLTMTKPKTLLHIIAPEGMIQGTFHLPVSKSLVNRQLILHALSGRSLSPLPAHLPDDVAMLASLLDHPGPVWDAGAGGTTFRFLLAFLALSGKKGTITGSDRLCKRPVGSLVEGLRQIGADIDYVGMEDFPPLLLKGFTHQQQNVITIDAATSSQFLTALLLVAPLLPNGLTLQWTGEPVSRPYLEMTLRVLTTYGVPFQYSPQRIHIDATPVLPHPFLLESDWTAASYAYSLVAMAPIGSYLDLPGLRLSGWQGDEILSQWMSGFGIETFVTAEGCRIVHSLDHSPSRLDLDMEDHPDLAQTLITLCAMKGIPGRFTGLQTLLIKETNRTAALQTELANGGVTFHEAETGVWVLSGIWKPTHLPIGTYHDHRMAMSMSLASFSGEVTIAEPDVVTKSFPLYWKVLQDLGFGLIQE